MDRMPKKTIKIASTHANTGRLMKNKAMVYTVEYLTEMERRSRQHTTTVYNIVSPKPRY